MEKFTEQEKLIGKHPSNSKVFGEWLKAIDLPASSNRKHRQLIEDNQKRLKAIKKISELLLIHHASEDKLERIKKKKKILDKHGFQKYLRKNNPIPSFEKTKRGNCAEIILAEYLVCTSNLNLLVYRLRYNTNIEQSMKGDDVLLLNKNNIYDKIIVGEAKFRKTPNKSVVDKIISSFEGNKRYPISLSFIAERVSESGNKKLAELIEDLQTEMYNLKTPIINVGFLFSNHNSTKIIEKNAQSENPNLIFLSLGVSDPIFIIDQSYKLAQRKLSE